MNYVLGIANGICLLTALAWILTGQRRGRLWNAAGGFWQLMLLADALCAALSFDALLPRIAGGLIPVVLVILRQRTAFALPGKEGAVRTLRLLTAAYFLLETVLYLRNGAAVFPVSRPIPSVWAVAGYGVLFAVFFGLTFYIMLHYQIVSVQSMRSPMGIFAHFYPVLFWIAVPLTGGLSARVLALSDGSAVGMAVVVLLGGLLAVLLFGTFAPVLSLGNALKNADDAWNLVYADAETEERAAASVVYSFPADLLGERISGVSVTENLTYGSFSFADGGGTDADETASGRTARDIALQCDLYRPTGETEAAMLPVIVRIHGSGGSKGKRNTPAESALLAREGFAVFDLNYGNEMQKPGNEQLAENICRFLSWLADEGPALGADPQRVILSGGSRGGKMTMMAAVRWANNTYENIRNRVTLRGIVLQWAFMTDVFVRSGDERIVSMGELSGKLPSVLAINVTNDGSVQGGHLMEGVLQTHGVSMANIELRHAQHGPDTDIFGVWGQMNTAYFLRFARKMTQ